MIKDTIEQEKKVMVKLPTASAIFSPRNIIAPVGIAHNTQKGREPSVMGSPNLMALFGLVYLTAIMTMGNTQIKKVKMMIMRMALVK